MHGALVGLLSGMICLMPLVCVCVGGQNANVILELVGLPLRVLFLLTQICLNPFYGPIWPYPHYDEVGN